MLPLEHPNWHLPANRTPRPLRFKLAALNGIHPRERCAPRLTRHFSFSFLAALRFWAYSLHNRLNRIGADLLEVLRRAGREGAEVKTCEPFALRSRLCGTFDTSFITQLVEDDVHFTRRGH